MEPSAAFGHPCWAVTWWPSTQPAKEGRWCAQVASAALPAWPHVTHVSLVHGRPSALVFDPRCTQGCSVPHLVCLVLLPESLVPSFRYRDALTGALLHTPAGTLAPTLPRQATVQAPVSYSEDPAARSRTWRLPSPRPSPRSLLAPHTCSPWGQMRSLENSLLLLPGDWSPRQRGQRLALKPELQAGRPLSARGSWCLRCCWPHWGSAVSAREGTPQSPDLPAHQEAPPQDGRRWQPGVGWWRAAHA